jgi:hypothetical protein
MSAETFKTPFIKDIVRIYPFAGSSGAHGQPRPLGQVNFKMQLRKPVQETLRFFRERTEATNMGRAVSMGQQGLRPPRKMVTIQIIACSNL